jgi:hypothetical protein
MFVCDRCEHSMPITDETLDNAVSRLRAIGWTVSSHEEEYHHGAKPGKNGFTPAVLITSVRTVYDEYVCRDCAQK